jgi:death-on-curing protein
MAAFGGQYLHEDLFTMAAAYLFHLANNHAFVDGNKRTGLAAALVFLDANGFEIDDEGTELADMVLEMVEEKRDKAWVADELRRRANPRSE